MGGNMKDRWSVPVTAVANEFIDTYMAAANGEYWSFPDQFVIGRVLYRIG